MTNQAFPVVNGDECSWADIGIVFNIPGVPALEAVDTEAVKWSSAVDVGESRGTSGGRVMKTTAGSEKTEGSITLTRSGLVQLREGLEVAAIAAGQVRGDEVMIAGVRFTVLIQHTPLGSSLILVTRMVGCRYLGDSDDMKQGNEADTVEVTLGPVKAARKSSTGNWIVLR